jgi:elongation factor G
VRTRSDERLHGLHHLFGAKLIPVTRAVAGDVVVVAKLNDVAVGDVLAKRGVDLATLVAPLPAPALSVALLSTTRDDDDKIATALHRLAEEDPSLRVRHDPVSRRLVVDAMGDTHLKVTLERLRRRFNVNVTTATPDVQRYETIRSTRECEGRLKKQTGGHGQFAVVNLKVEPIKPDEPFEFVDAIVGGAVPRQFIAAVRNGVEKSMARGGPGGFPVVGLRVTLFDGKFHAVDSSEAAFDTAGSLGLRAALEAAGTVVLERIMEVTTTFPTEYLGEVLNDLKSRRGKVVATNQDNAVSVTVTSFIPEDGLHRYGLDFRAITDGRGRVTLQLHHLSEAP